MRSGPRARAIPRGCLSCRPGEDLEDRRVSDLPSLLRAGDVLVFNDTKVIPAQLHGVRERDGHSVEVAVTLIERIDASTWWALAKPGRRLAVGDRIRFGHEGRVCLLGTLEGSVEEKQPDGRLRLAFGFHGAYLDEAIRALGDAPLPPYIASRRRDRRTRPRGLSDGLCGGGGGGRCANSWAAFHAGAFGEAWRSGDLARVPDAACRAGHIHAGQG